MDSGSVYALHILHNHRTPKKMIELLYLAAFALAAYGTGSYALEKTGIKLSV